MKSMFLKDTYCSNFETAVAADIVVETIDDSNEDQTDRVVE